MRKQVYAVTIGVLLALSMLSVLTSTMKPVFASVLMSSGWENSAGTDVNDTGVWTNGTIATNMHISTSVVSHGSYALNVSSTSSSYSSYLYSSSLFNVSSLYYGFNVYLTALPTTFSQDEVLGGLNNSNSKSYLLYVAYNATYGPIWGFSNGLYSSTSNATTGPSINNWYRCVMNISNVLSQQITLWVNGTIAFTTNFLNVNNANLTNAIIGPDSSSLGYGVNGISSAQLIFDDVMVGNSYADVATWSGGSGDISPPTYSNLAVNTTKAGAVAKISVYVTDDYGLSGYILQTNTTGTLTNDTWIPFTANPQWANVSTHTWNSTIGYKTTYGYFFNDSSNNWGSTGLQLFTSTPDDPPTCSTISVSSTAAGASATFSFLVADDLGLSKWMFQHNSTGTPTNETSWTAFSSNPETVNIVKTLNNTAGNVESYKLWFNDTTGNFVNTGLISFTLDASLFNLTITSSPINVGYIINSTSLGGYSFVAASGSPSDIQAAWNNVLAAGGGTVYIPAGTFTFNPTTMGTVNMTYTNVKMSIIGAGVGVTILQETIEPSSTFMFRRTWNGQNYNGAPVRFSGISFKGYVDNEITTGNNAISFKCTIDFRIDHCAFEDFESSAIGVGSDTGGTYHLRSSGLVDHCTFDNPYKDILYPSTSCQWGYGMIIGGSNYYWENLNNLLGQFDNPAIDRDTVVYVENCVFNRCRYAIAGNAGGFYVARYNIINVSPHYGSFAKSGLDAHTAAAGTYGTRGYEIYNNTINGCAGGQSAFKLRCGGGVVYNNTLNNLAVGSWLIYEGIPEVQHYVHDVYIWDNVYNNVGAQISVADFYAEETDYHLHELVGYVSYIYPHPFTQTSLTTGTTNSSQILVGATYLVAVPNSTISGGTSYLFSHWQDASTNTTLTVVLSANTTITATYTVVATVVLVYVSPLNQTYNSPTIPIDFYASGGTIDKLWFNVKNGTNWIYGSNQTFTTAVNITSFTDGTSYTFVGYANNTLGTVGSASVVFSVQIILPYTEITSTWWQFWW